MDVLGLETVVSLEFPKSSPGPPSAGSRQFESPPLRFVCSVVNPAGQPFCDTCGRTLGTPEAPAANSPSHAPAAVGGGRYQIHRALGEGAKKVVYLAHDTRLDREVAIALVKTEGLDEAGLARVTREARAMGRLGDHPHVVTVHDVGEEGRRPYIVSEYMAGGSIEDLLARTEGRRLPLEQALRLASEICDGLAHVHGQGVIHRDLKSGNVWLSREGTAKLGDFGLALALDRSRLTVEGMMVGTVALASDLGHYRAPTPRNG